MIASFFHRLALSCSLAALCCAVLPAAAQGGMLRVPLTSDIRSTDPGTNRDDNTDAVVLHIVEGLVALREDTSIGSLLASKVDVSPDGLGYTFTLREGIKFHNGAPLTAEDVVWSWKRYLDPATGWRCLPEVDGRGMTKITAVEAEERSVRGPAAFRRLCLAAWPARWLYRRQEGRGGEGALHGYSR